MTYLPIGPPVYSRERTGEVAGTTVEGRGSNMLDPLELIREKEKQILRLRQEIETLRVAARLLKESDEASSDEKRVDRRLLQMP